MFKYEEEISRKSGPRWLVSPSSQSFPNRTRTRARRTRAKASPIERLSDREFEVFPLIGGGKSTVQIAEELHLSTKTVESHRARVEAKLDLRTMTELISFASRWVETQDAR